jgi:3-hydroxyisobutyrate dehydrogenase-like beta-hydroxyacid dehydrogenase
MSGDTMDPNVAQPVGLIGIGLLGQALAEAMTQSGYTVVGWDRDPDRCRGAENAAEVFEKCTRILLCLPTYFDSRHVLDQAPLRAGHQVADISTGSPADAEALSSELSRRGVQYVDATVSGSSAQALRRELLVMAGGEAALVDCFQDIFTTFASRVIHVGPVGSGAKMKLVTNLVLGLNRAALAEGLAFASALGLPASAALDVMRQSMAYSRIMDTKGEKMVRRDFTPEAKLSQHLKDVRLMMAATGMPLPLTRAHCAILEKALEQGFGDLDNSALISTYQIEEESQVREK